MQQKTIFLNFYKTKDCFFNLIIKAKDLCAQYICSSETPEVFPQKCSSKRTNTFLEEHRLGSASGTFGNVLHYFSAISPFCQKQSPRCVPQIEHCLNYVRLRIFSDRYFPVQGQNLRK